MAPADYEIFPAECTEFWLVDGIHPAADAISRPADAILPTESTEFRPVDAIRPIAHSIRLRDSLKLLHHFSPPVPLGNTRAKL
jgi:hypothetical protein